MQVVEVREKQRESIGKTIRRARRIRTELQPLLDAHREHIHFRPSSTVIAMVGLLDDRPQRGKSKLTKLERLSSNFEALFDAHCRTVEHGRVTGEKALQSYLISEAQTSGGRLGSINAASAATDDPVEFVFVTDEIALPLEAGKIVCDILAPRPDGGRTTPVLIELKNWRELTRLVEQVDGYAKLIDEHADLFAELFSTLLGKAISFDAPTEKWLVWPEAGTGGQPQAVLVRLHFDATQRVPHLLRFQRPDSLTVDVQQVIGKPVPLHHRELAHRNAGPRAKIQLIHILHNPTRSPQGAVNLLTRSGFRLGFGHTCDDSERSLGSTAAF